MARSIRTRVNGRWKFVRHPTVRVGDNDSKIIAGWTKVAGEWRQFWPPHFPAAVVVIGAGGGTGGNGQLAGYTGNPGHQVTGVMGIGVDQTLTISIGSRGYDGGSGGGSVGGQGGIGDFGSSGGSGASANSQGSGGGGGAASVIAVNGQIIVVAAGGAGGGGGNA